MTEWIITSSALILIVMALRGLLKGKISLRLQYGLWALVLVRLLFPFSITESAMSLGNVAEDIRQQPIIQQTDTAVRHYESAYEEIVSRYESLGIPVTPAQTRQEAQDRIYNDTYNTMADAYTQEGVEIPEAQLQQEVRQQVESISLIAMVTEALPTVWYTGMALIGCALLSSNLYFYWRLRKSRVLLEMPEIPLRVYHTDYVATPCLFGLVRPGIYLTDEVVQDTQMRNHVLAHELTHYRHRDHIWSILRGVCLMLHWYNPLVWAAAILSKRDAELACDESTIKTLGEQERMAYGKTLIGMTCVKHDPKNLFLTATTMIGSKKTLKERISLIAKKPKTAIVTLIACLLVVSIAVGCTFTGSQETPTEPTSPEDAVYNKLKATVQELRSREAYHFKNYITLDHPADQDPTANENFIQGWISGADMYVEQAYWGPVTPNFVRYNGAIYSHMRDNLWMQATASSTDTDTYRITLPSRNDYTMTWSEAEDHLDITFVAKDDPDSSILFRLDPDGGLVWYAPYEIIGSITNAETGETFTAPAYSVLIYPDMDAEAIRQHLDTVVPPLIAGMEEWDGSAPTTDPTEPVTEPTEPATEPPQPLPTVPDTVQALPEGYTLADLVASYEEDLSWTDQYNNTYFTTFSMPLIYPFSQGAIAAQQAINDSLLIWLQELRDAAADAYDYSIGGVWYETSLNDGVLSILTAIEWNHESSSYSIYNFDLETGKWLTTADMVARYLPDLSYPEFLMSTVQLMEETFHAEWGNSSVYELHVLPSENTYALASTQLYLDDAGILCIRYDRQSMAGAGEYPTLIPFSPEELNRNAATLREAYGWLFSIRTDQDHMREAHAAMLFQAFYAAPVEFVQHLTWINLYTDDVVALMGAELQHHNPEVFAQVLTDLRFNGGLSEREHGTLDLLFDIRQTS